MQPVAIVTDSVATVPETLRRDLGIRVIPLSIELDGVVYRDCVDLTPADFYARMAHMAARDDAPKTSQPSPGAWIAEFEAAAGTGAQDILCLTMSSALSGTHASAVQAARIFSDDAPFGGRRPKVWVRDTGLATIAEGWVVIEAARAARAGRPAAEVRARASEASARANMLVAVDTMDYLARGGHVPGLVAAFAGTLGLKPLIRFRDGHPTSAGLATSTSHAMEVMSKRLLRLGQRARTESQARDGALGARARVRIGVMHAGVPERGRELAALVKERLNPDELLVTGFTPVMGAHTGPGLFGVAYLMD